MNRRLVVSRIILEVEELTQQQAEFAYIMFNVERSYQVGSITVKDNEGNLKASVVFRDAEDHETTPTDTPVWDSSDTNVVVAHAADDGMTATFDVGAPGVAIVSVTSGDIRSEGTVTVQPGDAVIGEVNFSTT